MAALRGPKVGTALSFVTVVASLAWATTNGAARIVSIVVCAGALGLSVGSTLIAGSSRERRHELLGLLAIGIAVTLVLLTGSVIPIAAWFVLTVVASPFER